jgi:predicted N-acyltransferase
VSACPSTAAKQCVVADSIAAFARDDWNRCFPGALEDWDYLRAVEDAGIAGFTWRYLGVVEGTTLLAAVPAFITSYRLDTTVQGMAKRMTERIARRFPAALSIRLLCLGSPVTETCPLGFAPEVTEHDKSILLAMLIERLTAFARAERIGLLAVKDARDADGALWDRALSGFARMAGLPSATLTLPFTTFDGYLGSLSAATRKDMRRKLRGEGAIRIEQRTSVDDVMDRLMALYDSTLARSDLHFERLSAAYFANVLARMPDRARCVLYWKGADLLAFNLVLQSPERLIDKFIGTGETARADNIYFLSWMENVRRCIAERIPVYESGQAGYAVKVRLGSKLSLNWNYFRHLNPAVNAILRLVARLVRLDRFDPEIRLALTGPK